MSERTTNIAAYLTPVGWLAAFVFGDRARCRFHLNQGLMLELSSLVLHAVYRIVYRVSSGVFRTAVGGIGSLAEILFLVFMILGIVNAVHGEEKELPLIGSVRLLK